MLGFKLYRPYIGHRRSDIGNKDAEAVGNIRPSLPPGLEILPYYNRADLIGLTIQTVEHSLAEGAVLVMPFATSRSPVAPRVDRVGPSRIATGLLTRRALQ